MRPAKQTWPARRVEGLELCGLGFGVSSLGRFEASGFGGLRVGIWGLEFRIWCFRAWGFGGIYGGLEAFMGVWEFTVGA